MAQCKTWVRLKEMVVKYSDREIAKTELQEAPRSPCSLVFLSAAVSDASPAKEEERSWRDLGLI